MKKKLLYTLTAIMAVALVAVGTVLLLQQVAPRDKTPDQTAAALTLSSLVDELKATLKDAPGVNVITAQAASPTAVLHSLGDRVWVGIDTGASFITVTTTGTSASDSTRYADSTVTLLRTRGFSEHTLSQPESRNDESITSLARYFASNTITCTVIHAVGGAPFSLYINCANVSDFAKNSEKIAPFVDAYKTQATDRKDVLLMSPEIQDSSTKDYKYALVDYSLINADTEGAQALFYQQPDKTWHFFTVAQERDKISCSNYKTPEQIDAFVGFACWDEKTNSSSFVQRENPTFDVVPGASGG